MSKTRVLSAEGFLQDWAKGSGPHAAVAAIILLQIEDYRGAIKRLEGEITAAVAVVSERLAEPHGSLAECITRIADQREEARDQRDAITRQAMKFEAALKGTEGEEFGK